MIVKYFGVVSDIVKKDTEEIYFSGSFKELIDSLSKKYNISRYLDDYSLLLNGEYVSDNKKLKNTDVLVFLPITMGG